MSENNHRIEAGPERNGIVFIVVSPSGGGKTTLCQELLNADDNLVFSVSYTSRPPRPGETEGKDYYFIDEQRFRSRIEEGGFLEWAEVHGHLYGTSKEKTDEILARGLDVLMDIDVQGAAGVKERMPDCVRILILPPSRRVLETRLRARNTDSEESLQRRLDIAASEISRCLDFDYLVINDSLQAAAKRLAAIISAERARIHRGGKKADEILRSFGLTV